MKQPLKSTKENTDFESNEKKVNTNVNHLYSLLFAGKITLKDYLKELKKLGAHQPAA